jgi:hypothetical protein
LQLRAMIFWRNLRPAGLARVIEAIAHRLEPEKQPKPAAGRPVAAPGKANPSLRVVEGR